MTIKLDEQPRVAKGHGLLVELAAKRLASKHSVVVTEIATAPEEPDVLGFHGKFTTLIECKATRSDFFADRNKIYRYYDPGAGMGTYRYYLSYPGVIKPDEMPVGWGLWEVKPGGKRIKQVRESKSFHTQKNNDNELQILVSIIRRIGEDIPGLKGVSAKFYVIPSNNFTTVGVRNEDD